MEECHHHGLLIRASVKCGEERKKCEERIKVNNRNVSELLSGSYNISFLWFNCTRQDSSLLTHIIMQ